MSKIQSAAPAPPVGHINITILADGAVRVAANVPNRSVMLMALETAKFDLERKIWETEKAQTGIQLPPPGLDGSKLRTD